MNFPYCTIEIPVRKEERRIFWEKSAYLSVGEAFMPPSDIMAVNNSGRDESLPYNTEKRGAGNFSGSLGVLFFLILIFAFRE